MLGLRSAQDYPQFKDGTVYRQVRPTIVYCRQYRAPQSHFFGVFSRYPAIAGHGNRDGDGHLGIWGALRNVYPQAAEQRCWNHKIVNVLAKLPKRQQDQAKLMLRTIPYAPTRTEAERLRTVFTRWCGDHSYEAASEALERDWDRMVTFYDFPKEHWGHLRTTNPVESPFAALRLRTDAAKRYKRVDRAIAVIWKMLMVAEQRFRRLKAPELIEDVYLGAQYADGIAIESTAEKVAA